MANILLVLVAIAAMSVAYGQVVSDGSCPTANGIAAFTPGAYIGKWYLISSYPHDFETGQCIKGEYALAADASTMNVNNTQRLTTGSESAQGTAVVSSDDLTGELAFTVLGFTQQSATILVLDTDYSSYAINYACTNIGSTKSALTRRFEPVTKMVSIKSATIPEKSVWIFSRTMTMTTAAAATVNTYIASNSLIDPSQLIEQDQTVATCTAEN